MMHHPPKFSEKSPDWISLDSDSTKKLHTIVKDYKVMAIICGHVHINQSNFWNNIPVIISNGLHSTIDFSEFKKSISVLISFFKECSFDSLIF